MNTRLPRIGKTSYQRLLCAAGLIAEKDDLIMSLFRRTRLVAITAGFALTCVTPPMKAADDEGGKKCSNATLKGDYGLHATGIRVARPPAGMGQQEMHATIALRTYDGKGGFTGLGIVSNGQVTGVTQGTPTSGTYQVNDDCSGTITINIPGVPVSIRSAFVIVDRGKEIKEAPLTPGEVGIAILRRM